MQACNPNTCVLPFPKVNYVQNGKFHWHTILYEINVLINFGQYIFRAFIFI